MSQDQLQKLTITGYSDSSYSEDSKSSTGTFTVLVNPESYSKNLKVEWEEPSSSGTSSKTKKFKRIIQPDLDISILFDGTGVIQTDGQNNVQSVIDQIDEFESIVSKYQGDFHKPNHVIVHWGSLYHKGVLSDISYEYKLFKSNGDPLRVVAKVSFKNAWEEEYRAAKENQKSPDLTHVRMVVEGDTLPQLSNKIYGDSKYYLEIARANNLTNFRKLTPGQQLSFPPIEKLAQ